MDRINTKPTGLGRDGVDVFWGDLGEAGPHVHLMLVREDGTDRRCVSFPADIARLIARQLIDAATAVDLARATSKKKVEAA